MASINIRTIFQDKFLMLSTFKVDYQCTIEIISQLYRKTVKLGEFPPPCPPPPKKKKKSVILPLQETEVTQTITSKSKLGPNPITKSLSLSKHCFVTSYQLTAATYIMLIKSYVWRGGNNMDSCTRPTSLFPFSHFEDISRQFSPAKVGQEASSVAVVSPSFLFLPTQLLP